MQGTRLCLPLASHQFHEYLHHTSCIAHSELRLLYTSNNSIRGGGEGRGGEGRGGEGRGGEGRGGEGRGGEGRGGEGRGGEGRGGEGRGGEGRVSILN